VSLSQWLLSSFLLYVSVRPVWRAFGKVVTVSAVTATIGVPVAVASMVVVQGNPPFTIASPGAQVAITRPAAGSVVRAGDSIPVGGTVSGLKPEDRLWIILRSEPDVNEFYYLVQNTPAAYRDGAWRLVSKPTSDHSSKGRAITFIALQADSSCDDVLSTLPSDDNCRVSLPAIPDGCVEAAERSIAMTP
jgi:hypothetical protein